MGAWTNHKATAVAKKEVDVNRMNVPRKVTDFESGTVAAKAVEHRHQRAAVRAARELARGMVAESGGLGSAGATPQHVTIQMSGTASNPPVAGDVITVAVTLAADPGAELESDVAGRV